MIERIFNAEFASQTDLEKLPNGYIDKTVTGCGLTSLAIEKEPNSTIIAVPSKHLVFNKVQQYPNKRFKHQLLGVTGETTNEDIDNFLMKNPNFYKIIVTYDSLPRLTHLLSSAHLVIDECDKLFTWSQMKCDSKRFGSKDVMTQVLDICEQYKDSVSFISATPVPVELFDKQWMLEIPQIKYYWTQTKKTQPILMKTGRPVKALKYEILKPLKKQGVVTIGGATFKKVIVFYNSVQGINELVDELDLPTEDCGIICGDTVKNSANCCVQRVSSVENLPKYTFVTSTGFSGIDLYSDDAISIVISSTNKNWSMIDLNTDLKQAISRQRNKTNPNYGKFIFIYNQAVFELTDDEMLSRINALEISLGKALNNLNKLYQTNPDEYQATLQFMSSDSDFSGYTYFDDVQKMWKINYTRFNADRYFIQTVRKEYTQGFDLMGSLDTAAPIVVKVGACVSETSYAPLVDKYQRMIDGEDVEWTKEELRCDNYALIDQYYKTFGKLNKDSSKAQILLSDKDKFTKVKVLAHQKFTQTGRYTADEVKQKLQQVYNQLGITRKAKATDALEIGMRKVQLTNGERVYTYEKK